MQLASRSSSSGVLEIQTKPHRLKEEVTAREKTIGIIGGVGPLATAELFLRLIKGTPAETDREHLHILIDSNPKIPDFEEALLGDGASPLPALQRSARNLEQAEADFLLLPCAETHFWRDEIQEEVNIPVLSMIELPLLAIKQHHVGLLAGTATLRLRLYHEPLEVGGVRLIEPEEPNQQNISTAIGLVKKGEDLAFAHQVLDAAVADLKRAGAQALLLGCAELSILLKQQHVLLPVYDALDMLVAEAILYARMKRLAIDF